ncbi:flagellar hook-length control protein FliK [bacterium]|nr:flagellar hook-length control protein FliK [bacterium]
MQKIGIDLKQTALNGISTCEDKSVKGLLNLTAVDNELFNEFLMNSLKAGQNHSPPIGRSDSEKLAAEASSSADLQRLLSAGRNSNLKFPSKLEDEILKAERSGIREESSQAERVRRDHAHDVLAEKLNKPFMGDELKEALNQAHERLNESALSEFDQNSKINHELHEAYREMIKLENLPFEVNFDTLPADAVMQNLWSLPEDRSIFDKGRKSEIPHKTDRERTEKVDAEIDTARWDEQFETEWAKSTASDSGFSPQDNNPQSSSTMVSDARAASGGRNGNPLPDGDRIFYDLVNRAKINIENGNYRMSLELHPEHLGAVSMRVAMEGSKMTARFLVENGQVRQLLLSKMNELKSALNKSGVEVERIDVMVSGEQTASPAHNHRELDAVHSDSRFDFPNTRARIAYFNSNREFHSSTWLI